MRWSTFFFGVGVVGLASFGLAAVHGHVLTMTIEATGFLFCHWMVGEPYIDEWHPKWVF